MTEILLLIISLLTILVSAEIFTNSIEVLGKKLSLSQAVVGSILAAVGTALPETILPFVAILLHGGDVGRHIGMGAILGAPFMLATLAFFLVGIAVIVGFIRKKRKFELRVELRSMRRDLVFFIIMFGAAISVPHFVRGGREFMAAGLIMGYLIYAYLTFKGDSEVIVHSEELYFGKLLGLIRRSTDDNVPTYDGGILLAGFQVLFAIALMVGGAHVFVSGLETLSRAWGVSPLLFSLLVAPIATELPEKFNSVSWTIKGRDALAVGNITGAMVFQSTFPVSLGLLFTDWAISGLALLSAAFALASAVVLLMDISVRKKLSPLTVILGGVFYLFYAISIMRS
ncbi:MAG: sodium:calcium antiporter [Dissulfurispiraceae bacterium]|jgi:cation:H+ antiporter